MSSVGVLAEAETAPIPDSGPIGTGRLTRKAGANWQTYRESSRIALGNHLPVLAWSGGRRPPNWDRSRTRLAY